MRNHTDSIVTVYNEDGSWTTTTEVTEFPMTKADQAKAWGALGGLTALAFAPVIVIVVQDWRETRRERKRREKLESVKD